MRLDQLLPSDQMKSERLEDQFQEAGRDIEDLDVLGAGVHRAILK